MIEHLGLKAWLNGFKLQEQPDMVREILAEKEGHALHVMHGKRPRIKPIIIGESIEAKCSICQNEVSNVIGVFNEKRNIRICQECYNMIQTAILTELLKKLNPCVITDLIEGLKPYKTEFNFKITETPV